MLMKKLMLKILTMKNGAGNVDNRRVGDEKCWCRKCWWWRPLGWKSWWWKCWCWEIWWWKCCWWKSYGWRKCVDNQNVAGENLANEEIMLRWWWKCCWWKRFCCKHQPFVNSPKQSNGRAFGNGLKQSWQRFQQDSDNLRNHHNRLRHFPHIRHRSLLNCWGPYDSYRLLHGSDAQLCALWSWYCEFNTGRLCLCGPNCVL